MDEPINGHEKKTALLVILMSPCDAKGEPTTWTALHPDAVPEWIAKDEEVIRNMVAGEMCQQKDAPLAWYRCERVIVEGMVLQ